MPVAFTIPLERLMRCFQAVIPGMLSTVSKDGVPHMIAVTHVHLIDDRHVAISRQFQRKTPANLAENARATVIVIDPPNLGTYRLGLRYEREETAGALFDEMTTRLAAVASMTGMVGVFHLKAAMVFEVLSVDHVPGVLEPGEDAAPPPSPVAAIDDLTQLRVLRQIGEAVSASADAEALLDSVLGILEDGLGFQHSMILLVDEGNARLDAVASRGYAESGIGAEVHFGEGIIGTVASSRKLLRLTGIDRARRYARAVRSSSEGHGPASKEILLPGLADAESQLALPLLAKNELLGVLFVESRRQFAYGERDEAFLDVVAGQVAMGLQSLMRAEDPEPAAVAPKAEPAAIASGPTRVIQFFPADDCIFVDGQYLIRNIPGRILWTLLRARIDEGRSEFSNRELRLDASLGLPPVRDNLESRLILLRKRLVERCPDLRLVSTGRGRFALDVRCRLELQRKD